MNLFAQPYPLDALPSFVRDAAWEVKQFVQCTEAQAGMAFVAGMAIPCQSLADLKDPLSGKRRAISVNQMHMSESGDRTTTTDSLVLSSIFQHDAAATSAYADKLKEHRARRTVWASIEKGLNRRLVKLKADGKDTDAIEVQLAEHGRQEPSPPRLRRFIRQDITARSIMDALSGSNESLAFVTDEGQTLFDGDLMRHIGKLNSFWDGPPSLTLDRADGESVIAHDARVSMYFKAHEVAFRKYAKKHGNMAHGTGLWARFLVAKPESLKGRRWVSNLEFKPVALSLFHARMTELMSTYDERVSTGPFEREVIEFSDEARSAWILMAQQVENDQQPGCWLHHVSDHASKFMENVGRMAAIFHYFSKQEGKISSETLHNAQRVVYWHLLEHVRLFSPQGALSEIHAAARDLIDFLRPSWKGWGIPSMVSRSEILRRGPASVRNAARLNAVLQMLCDEQAIAPFREPTERQKEYVVLQDMFFGRLAA